MDVLRLSRNGVERRSPDDLDVLLKGDSTEKGTVTLPVTALSSIVGLNVIVNDSTHVGRLVVLLTVMGVMSAMLLLRARRKGWW